MTILTALDFALKLRSMFGNTYVCESTFSTMTQIKSEAEIEWQTKHQTVVSDLLPLTLRYC